MLPLISIIIPVYNIEHYIGKCLDSILEQTFTDFEAIIVDDASSDETLRICGNYAQKDNRIKIFSISKQGVAGARNRGLMVATGRYISFIDGDDYVHPLYLEKLYYALKNNEADIAVCNHYFIKGKQKIIRKIPAKYKDKPIPKENLYKYLFGSSIFTQLWGKLYDTKIIKNKNFENFMMGEDLEFNSRVYLELKKMKCIDLPLYYYVKRKQSITNSKFSITNFDSVNCRYQCYLNLKDNKKYSVYPLKELYKYILSFRYECTADYKDQAQELIDEILHETYREFVTNCHINPFYKLIIYIFFKSERLYAGFRIMLEFLVKAKNRTYKLF